MTSRYQDNFRHTSFQSSFSAPTSSTRNTSVSSSNTLIDTKPHHHQKTAKWYNPANLLKITPEPVNPWASDPFSSSTVSKEDSRRASLSGDCLPDQRRGYLGKKVVVGYYRP